MLGDIDEIVVSLLGQHLRILCLWTGWGNVTIGIRGEVGPKSRQTKVSAVLCPPGHFWVSRNWVTESRVFIRIRIFWWLINKEERLLGRWFHVHYMIVFFIPCIAGVRWRVCMSTISR